MLGSEKGAAPSGAYDMGSRSRSEEEQRRQDEEHRRHEEREESRALARRPLTADDPVSAWMTEMTLLVEQLAGRVGAVEKSVDGMRLEVRMATDTSKIAALALQRIAKAEEDRAETERERLEQEKKERLENKRSRERWASRFWESPALQMLLTGLVLGVLQLLGLGWFARTVLTGADE